MLSVALLSAVFSSPANSDPSVLDPVGICDANVGSCSSENATQVDLSENQTENKHQKYVNDSTFLYDQNIE